MKGVLLAFMLSVCACLTHAAEQGDRLILVTAQQSDFRAHDAPSLSLKHYPTTDRYQTPAALRLRLRRIGHDHGIEQVDGWPIPMLGVYCAVFEVPVGADVDRVLEGLNGDSRVDSAQRMNTFRSLSASQRGDYDDPYFELQYGRTAAQIEAIHRITRGRGVRIAVIDSAVAWAHPDLRGQIRSRRDFVSKGLGSPDGELHGTAMAGVLAALPDNGLGIVGLAPDAEVLGLRACWQESSRATCTSFTLLKAIASAVESNVDLLNMSLGGPNDPLVERALIEALKRNITVVAAVDPLAPANSFPADVPGVIAAGDPGVESRTEYLTTVPGDDYAFVAGTSVAAVRTTGLLALLMSADDPMRSHLLTMLENVAGFCDGAIPVKFGFACGRPTTASSDVTVR